MLFTIAICSYLLALTLSVSLISDTTSFTVSTPGQRKSTKIINCDNNHINSPRALHILYLSSDSSSDSDTSSLSLSNIQILYESENIIAINKPPHIAHHDSQDEIGIISHIRQLQNLNQFPYKSRIYGVHRLDKVTSGILLLAKNKETANALVNCFREKKDVTKLYIALSDKKPRKKKQGWVKGDMVPSRRGSWKLVNGKEQKNPAVSRFFTAGLGLSNIDVTNFISTSSSNGNDDVLIPKTLILFHPYTGKTHQLRVAAKSLGLPILGDTRYGTSTSNYNRTFLHALAIHVKVNNEDIAIWNPPSWFERRMPASEGKVDANNIQEGKKEGDCALHIMEKIVRKHCDDDFILNNIPLS